VTITVQDEVRRVKSRFSRPVILRVFPHNPLIADIRPTATVRGPTISTARRIVKGAKLREPCNIFVEDRQIPPQNVDEVRSREHHTPSNVK
jgi:hypothetical protein